MSDLLREIDQELRQDKARELLLRYGKQFLIGSVIIVLLVAIGVYLRNQDIKQRAATTLELVGIIGEGPTPTDLDLDALEKYVASAHGELASLGKFHMAGELARRGQKDDAIKIYRELAVDGSLTDELQDLAVLLDIMLRVDDGEPQSLIKELAPLTLPTIAWSYTARELTALLQIKAGDLNSGREGISSLLDVDGLPINMRRRLYQWQEIYGVPEGAKQS
jgi:hypothetical protein